MGNEPEKVMIEKMEDKLQQQENEVCDYNDSKDTSLVKDEINTTDDIEKIVQVKDEDVMENTESIDNPPHESTEKIEKKEEESIMTNGAPTDLKENENDANINTNTTNDAASIKDKTMDTKEVETNEQGDNMDQTSKNLMVDIELLSKDTNVEKKDEDPNG